MKETPKDTIRLINSFRFWLSDNQLELLKESVNDAVDRAYQKGLDDQSKMPNFVLCTYTGV